LPALFRAILRRDTPPLTSNQLVAWPLSNQQLQRQSWREAVQAGEEEEKCLLSGIRKMGSTATSMHVPTRKGLAERLPALMASMEQAGQAPTSTPSR